MKYITAGWELSFNFQRNASTMVTTTVMTHINPEYKDKDWSQDREKDQSHDYENVNELSCVNDAQNLKDVEQLDFFRDG